MALFSVTSKDLVRARGRQARRQAQDPTLDDLLAEPIIRLVMASDGVDAQTVHRLVDHLAHPDVER